MSNAAYISVTGSYGLRPGYASAREVLDEMDRMGICQTVLEFTAVSGALFRNRVLLQDIAELPEARARIIPAFSLDMMVLFQHNGMPQLLEMLEKHRPCCVTVRPESGSHRLRAIDAVLEKISHLDPVVLMDYGQIVKKSQDGDDLLYLAKRFPNMSFVIRQFIHSGWPYVYDTVRRADNIYLDISREHTMHAVQLACEFLGEDKVLFGQGRRGDGGACMGAVAYAKISEEAKEKVRCKNFIRLFKRPEDREHLTRNLKVLENKVANSLWTPFIEGKGITDAEVYDVHTHMGCTSGYGYVYDYTFQDQLKNFREHMDIFNIRKFVSTVTGIPDPVRAYKEAEANLLGQGEAFKGYVYFKPTCPELYTDEFFAERFATGYYVGLKSLPHYMKTPILDKKYERMFQYAHDHSLPILLHTDTGLGNPKDCAEMASRYPNAKVILGHSGLHDAGRLQCEEVAQDPKYNNVYFEICGSFLAERKWEESLEYIDYRRVLYGTDAPIHSMVWELARILSADIPDEQLRAILGGNAKRIFGFA